MKILALLFCLWTSFVLAYPPFDRNAEREDTFELFKRIDQRTVLKFDDRGGSAKVVFLRYFVKKLWPHLQEQKSLLSRERAYNVAVDRALYNNEEEKAVWQEIVAASEKKRKVANNTDEWKAKVLSAYRLAEGLEGEIPDYVRRLQKEIEVAAFTEAEAPDIDIIAKASTRTSDVANTSPISVYLPASEQLTQLTLQNFYGGVHTAQEAARALEALVSYSGAALGQEVAMAGEANFQKIAEARTRLAKSRGYRNWGEYQVASQGLDYTEQFGTLQAQVAFLRSLLAETDAPFRAFLAQRTKGTPGIDLEHLRPAHLTLLRLPDTELLRDYVGFDHIDSVWREVMLESGFGEHQVDSIVWDNYPRPGKQTHAYMENVTNPTYPELKINVETLSFEDTSHLPIPSADIYVVQNFRDHGYRPAKVKWHEGGHGVDFAYRRNWFPFEGSNAWAETHSIFMETFLREPEIWKRLATKPIPDEVVEQYLRNSRMNFLMDFRRQVALALFDLELWNYEYGPGKAKFINRAPALFEQIMGAATLTKPRAKNGIRPGMACFSTSHFTSGLVRYIGYVLAYVAAEAIHNDLLDRFESSTGRRSLMHQPELARYLIKGLYEKGALRPFPEPVEQFTGKKFSAKAFAKSIVADARKYRPGPFDRIKNCGRKVDEAGKDD